MTSLRVSFTFYVHTEETLIISTFSFSVTSVVIVYGGKFVMNFSNYCSIGGIPASCYYSRVVITRSVLTDEDEVIPMVDKYLLRCLLTNSGIAALFAPTLLIRLTLRVTRWKR